MLLTIYTMKNGLKNVKNCFFVNIPIQMFFFSLFQVMKMVVLINPSLMALLDEHFCETHEPLTHGHLKMGLTCLTVLCEGVV